MRQARSELFAVVLSPEVAASLAVDQSERVKELRGDSGLLVVMTDACAAADRQCMRDRARELLRQGVVTYVADPLFSTVGVSRIEVIPRRVLVVQNRRPDMSIDASKGVRYLSMPLNYLGYRVEFAEAGDALPAITADRYAGVVMWLEGPLNGNTAPLYRWVEETIRHHVPVAVLNDFGADLRGPVGKALGLRTRPIPTNGRIETETQDPMMGFEVSVTHDSRLFTAVQAVQSSKALLRVRMGPQSYEPAAITSWGGYVLRPYAALHDFRELDKDRWVVQPLAFLQQALRLKPTPIPDTTSENGRRLMTVHVDGDGFASRAEFPGGGYAGDVLLKGIFDRYRVPVTMSVIEGEVSADGMYPQLSATLEPIARAIFAKPYVEIASHTYSHPFFWGRTVTARAKDDEATPYHLPIPGYKLSLEREINGTINYINSRLAPSGKQVRIVLWPGGTQIPPQVLKMTEDANVLNLNGGRHHHHTQQSELDRHWPPRRVEARRYVSGLCTKSE